MDCDEWIQLDLDVDAYAARVGSSEFSLSPPSSMILTKFVEDVNFDQRLPNVDQRQGYYRRRGHA